jgi:hypothetical protein
VIFVIRCAGVLPWADTPLASVSQSDPAPATTSSTSTTMRADARPATLFTEISLDGWPSWPADFSTTEQVRRSFERILLLGGLEYAVIPLESAHRMLSKLMN